MEKDFICNNCDSEFNEDVLMRGEIYPRKPNKCPVCGVPKSEIKYLADKKAVMFWPQEKAMEHLFKLTKDSKTVGYCKWTEDWGWKYYNDLEPENEFTHFLVAQTGFTAHPFVTKDKNGKDVFEGDSVKSGKRILTILWGKDTLQWRIRLEESRYTTPLCQWAISKQFELIEDKEDA